jgi:hypothetical protein
LPVPVFTPDHLDRIGASHGQHASWAVWAGSRNRPSRAWLGDLSVLDCRADPRRLLALHRDVVLVALDAGPRPDDRPGQGAAAAWSAFHDPGDPTGRASVLAGAARGTPAWGSYLTPLLKPDPRTGRAPRSASPRPDELDRAVAVLQDELDLLGGDPVLVCLGEQVGAVVRDALGHRHAVRTVVAGDGPRSRSQLHTDLAGVLAGRVRAAAR